MTNSPVEKCVLTKTKEGPHVTVTSESDVDHLLWPSQKKAEAKIIALLSQNSC